MTLWHKIESLGGAVSGGAALIVAVVAIIQVRSTDDQLNRYMESFTPNMERLLTSIGTEQDAFRLKPAFQANNWQPMTAQELWDTEEIRSLELLEHEFMSIIQAGLKNGIVYVEYGESGQMPPLLSWSRVLEFSDEKD